MDRVTLGLTILGTVSAVMVFLAFALAKGKKYSEEDKANKKDAFKKSFLKAKSSK
ncbi:hypothetical protein KKC15_06595 [bacterium]|nr:hypothetical protein [bacterium]